MCGDSNGDEMSHDSGGIEGGALAGLEICNSLLKKVTP